MSDPAPPSSGGFHDDGHAHEHLCDHVLTRPEAHDWALVLSGSAGLVDVRDDAALLAVARSLFVPPVRAEGLALWEAYLDALGRSIDDALRLGWWWEEKDGRYATWHGLGPEGVFVVWDARVLKTGFLPRHAAFPPPRPPNRLIDPLPRRTGRRLPPPPPDTLDERYRLFKNNFDWVCAQYANAYHKGTITAFGGDAFGSRTPRLGRWQEMSAERLAAAAGAKGERT